LLGL
jgi:hypothetical protein